MDFLEILALICVMCVKQIHLASTLGHFWGSERPSPLRFLPFFIKNNGFWLQYSDGQCAGLLILAG